MDDHRPDVPRPIPVWPVWLEYVVFIAIVVILVISFIVLFGPQAASTFNSEATPSHIHMCHPRQPYTHEKGPQPVGQSPRSV